MKQDIVYNCRRSQPIRTLMRRTYIVCILNRNLVHEILVQSFVKYLMVTRWKRGLRIHKKLLIAYLTQVIVTATSLSDELVKLN